MSSDPAAKASHPGAVLSSVSQQGDRLRGCLLPRMPPHPDLATTESALYSEAPGPNSLPFSSCSVLL